jgi:hypothetical protein
MINIYDSVKDDMKTGDILYWRTNSLIGALIRAKTGGVGNHISQIIRLAEYEGEERRRYHTEALERGVYPNLLSQRIKEFSGSVWWLPLKEEWDLKRIGIGIRMAEMWGTEYDYASLFWQLIGKVNTDARQLFCSEFAWKALGFGGIAPNPKELAEDKAYLYKGMTLIWES